MNLSLLTSVGRSGLLYIIIVVSAQDFSLREKWKERTRGATVPNAVIAGLAIAGPRLRED